MATAIPSSMSFEMLSRLPANSFVLEWKEVRPDQVPVSGRWQLGVGGQRVRFHLRGAPNEFLLNTNVFLSGSAHLNVVGATTATAVAFVDEVNRGALGLNDPIHYFQGSRESFNAGALPYLDNQDTERSHQINVLRFRSARRLARKSGKVIDDLESCFSSHNNRIISSSQSDAVENTSLDGLRFYGTNGAGPGQVVIGGKNKTFKIPLGLYSNLVNSHSVVPLGLMSSFAVNGWSVEMETQDQPGADGKCFQVPALIGGGVASYEAYMNDLRIVLPIIKVLDPAVMEAVLSLYEKREMVNVGGVQFPLSLRMNSIAYRFSHYALQSGQSDYFFRVAGTDRSVRAVAWWIYRTSDASVGRWVINDGAVRVTRLETTIGNEQPHPVVEDQSVNTDNVDNFVAINAKHSASLFSPLPYYQESRKFDGQQDEVLSEVNNSIGTIFALGTSNNLSHFALASGYVSLENLDRREADYSGSFAASGKDLSNVGGIDIRMRIQSYDTSTVANFDSLAKLEADSSFGTAGVPNDSYRIVFAYAYDSVMEISPQGVMDVTNAVL